jgi:phosphatidylserine/phosphatidylglycerophosphate/cardiolipin synthase-like enzyme
MKISPFLILALFISLIPINAIAQTSILSAATYDLSFSPGTALQVVMNAINSAHSTLLMACYEFTDRDITEAIKAAAHRGVKVRIVAYFKAAHDKHSQVSILKSAGIPIRLDNHYAINNNKFMVIDSASVETCSFNYTSSAVKRNAENVFVLWNASSIAEE